MRTLSGTFSLNNCVATSHASLKSPAQMDVVVRDRPAILKDMPTSTHGATLLTNQRRSASEDQVELNGLDVVSAHGEFMVFIYHAFAFTSASGPSFIQIFFSV